jgi:hypothetical protein
MRSQTQLLIIKTLTAGALMVALVATACDTPFVAEQVPDDIVSPTVVGLIADTESLRAELLVILEDGPEISLASNSVHLTGALLAGNLFIAGQGGPRASDGRTWYVGVSARPSGCFYLNANGEVRGERMAFSYGFSLPLSDEWSEQETIFIDSPSVGFCLNENGEVDSPYSGSDSR